MDEKELKTSLKTRIFISLIAILMLGSVIASYALIVANGNRNNNNNNTVSDSGDIEIDEAKVAELEAKYTEIEKKFKELTKGDFDTFIAFKSEIRAYNEASANAGGVSTRDLKVGSGREISDGDSNYLAYYVGWCADETIFDSSFDNDDNPKAFSKILDASLGMIEGWNVGVVGMRLGGIREVTISSELAYGESMDICGGYNKPLKFLIMAKANEGDLANLAKELDEAYMRLVYAQYGMDYDAAKEG